MTRTFQRTYDGAGGNAPRPPLYAFPRPPRCPHCGRRARVYCVKDRVRYQRCKSCGRTSKDVKRLLS